MDAFGKEYHSWMLAKSVSECSIKIVCLKKGDWKDCVIYYVHVKCLIQNYVKFKTKKNFCTFLSSASYPLRGAQNLVIGHQVFCKQYSAKRKELKVYFPEEK